MRYISILLFIVFTGCATTQQPHITLRPVPKRVPPQPQAVKHFLRAQFAEKFLKQHDQAIYELQNAVRYDSTSATLYSALARNLTQVRRYKDAVKPAQQAVSLDPKDVETRWHYYQALNLGLRDTATAIMQLDAMINLDPKELKAYDELLQIYSGRGQRLKAIATLDRLIAMPDVETRVLLIAAENYNRHRAFQKAEKIYRDALAANPQNGEVRFKLGITQFHRADTLAAEHTFRKAIAINEYKVTKETGRLWGQLTLRIYNHEHHFNRLLAETPSDPNLIKQLSHVYLEMVSNRGTKRDDRIKFADMAERLFDLQLKTAPEDQHLLATKARLLLDTNRPEDARKYYRLANVQGEKAEYHLGIAHSFMAEENWTSAQQILEQLHELAPPKTKYYDQIVFDLARIYLRQDQIASARAVYQQAVDAIPEHTGFRYELARTYIFDRNWEKAIPLLEPLVDATENNAQFLQQVLFDLAQCLERADQFDRSVATFQRLLALNQDHAQASNYLGYMLAERGERLSEAKQYIERALNVDQENGAYLDSLGWVYYQMEQYPEAMRWLERALAIEEEALRQTDPNSPRMDGLKENLAVIHEHAGDAAKKMGDFARASRHYERAIEFDPENRTLQDKLKSLVEDASSSSDQ